MARFRSSRLIKILVFLFVATILVVVFVRVATGKSIGLKSFVSSAPSSIQHLTLTLLDSQRVRGYSQGQYTNIVFLHHSVGENLIQQGKVRQKFTKAGYAFWDQGYNGDQLKGPDGNAAGYSYGVPDDNTDPDGLAQIFAQPVYALSVNTFSGLLQHEVIIFKSCFPVSDIATDAQLELYKTYYFGIRNVMDQHPDRVFIVLTPPPLNPAETTAANAKRARAFANWLKSNEFWNKQSNFFVFDLFDAFAESNPASSDYSMLRQAYRDGLDSHPNAKANEIVAPALVDYVIQSIQTYRNSSSARK